MDHRLFYALGDLFASLVTGMLAGAAAWLIVSPGWHMFAAMILAMIAGMVVGLLMFFPFSFVLGAMEVMVPLMFNGMLAGMVVGMRAAMMNMALGEALVWGGIGALAGLAFVWTANALLRGVTREGEGA